MADQIVITEKTSQAKDVRAAVGSRYGDILPSRGTSAGWRLCCRLQQGGCHKDLRDEARTGDQRFQAGTTSSGSRRFATDTNTPGTHDTKIAGLIAYYPYCYDKVEFSAPTLVLIGEKDDWTPAALCQAVESKPNVKVVVFPGATHAFVMPFSQPVDYLGHHFVYDEKAAQNAQQDADAFLAARLK